MRRMSGRGVKGKSKKVVDGEGSGMARVSLRSTRHFLWYGDKGAVLFGRLLGGNAGFGN